jgi:flavin-dependent dehydrogenase
MSSAASGAAQVEVVIIGGGPAGASAARLLARWGHSVLLLTRPSPIAALAESIPPSCRKLFEQIGVDAAIDRASFVRTRGNTIYWGGEERIVNFDGTQYGYQVERAAFDEVLLGEATAAGAQVSRNAIVQRVIEVEQHTQVVCAIDGQPQTISAKWVLDCSGRSGVIARAYREPQPHQRTLALIGTWVHPDGWKLPDETHTLVESYDTGWAWSVPVSAQRRCIAVMVDPTISTTVRRSQFAELYAAEIARTQTFRALVAAAQLSGQPWACDASPYRSSRASAHGLLLVGDAASFVDPLSSFGIKKALASAWLAAVVTHTCLTQPELQLAALQFYETREAAMYQALQRTSAELARSAAGTHAHDFWAERAALDDFVTSAEPDVAALRNDPEILAAFAAIRNAASIQLKASGSVQRLELPVVRGNRIALAAHIANPAFPHGIRYVRDVDLLKLSEMATAFEHVPDLYEAYNRNAPPVALPDFLGALSMLIAKGVLEPA